MSEYFDHIPDDASAVRSLLQEKLVQIDCLEHDVTYLRQQNLELEKRLERTVHRRRELENLLSLHEKTGLPTHFRLKTELQETIDRLNNADTPDPLSVMILHIDKTINILQRTTKPSISEWVLYQLGNRFLEALDPRDRVFHTRDAEFVFLLFDAQNDVLYRKMKRIMDRMREPFGFANIKITLDGWAGVALYPEHGITRSSLMRHADVALGAASEQNRSIIMFQEELMAQVVEKIDLQNSIIRAIEAPAMANIGKQFALHYQPKVFVTKMDGDTAHLDRIEAEVLMRWQHPEKGAIPPDTFIPLAEETGLIMPMGKWVIYTAATQLQEWQDGPVANVPIALNLSARQMKNSEVLDITRSLITNRGIDPGSIIYEITETSIFEDPKSARRLMEELNDIGVRISIDDFGTGYSSLGYLSRFPLHEIKIDRSFITRFLQNPADDAIIRSIATLAQEMEWNVVAEGVEHIEEIQRLFEIGVNCFQGYYFCRPQPAAGFYEFADQVLSTRVFSKDR